MKSRRGELPASARVRRLCLGILPASRLWIVGLRVLPAAVLSLRVLPTSRLWVLSLRVLPTAELVGLLKLPCIRNGSAKLHQLRG